MKSLLKRNLTNPWTKNEVVLGHFSCILKEHMDIKKDMLIFICLRHNRKGRTCHGVPSMEKSLRFKHRKRK